MRLLDRKYLVSDCSGCGFTFRVGRGYRGNFYFEDRLIHACDYCGSETVEPFPPPRKARPS